jgi:hypothetical protein
VEAEHLADPGARLVIAADEGGPPARGWGILRPSGAAAALAVPALQHRDSDQGRRAALSALPVPRGDMSPACSAPVNRFVGGHVARGARACTAAPTETVVVRHRVTGTAVELRLCSGHAAAVRRRRKPQRAVEVVPSPILEGPHP